MLARSLLLILALLLSPVMWAVEAEPPAQTPLRTTDQCLEVANAAMDLIVKEQYADAIDLVGAHWPFETPELEQLKLAVVKQMPLAKVRFGKPLGYELLMEETIETSLLKLTYLQKNEHHPLVWEFTFYRSAEAWKTVGCEFKDDLDALFERLE